MIVDKNMKVTTNFFDKKFSKRWLPIKPQPISNQELYYFGILKVKKKSKYINKIIVATNLIKKLMTKLRPLD